ncbi:hypothetical protein [Paraflavitalea pollutisoli]|nr:hypothetical protein [Paraflavitalea sp. H1-2-19X]
MDTAAVPTWLIGIFIAPTASDTITATDNKPAVTTKTSLFFNK